MLTMDAIVPLFWDFYCSEHILMTIVVSREKEILKIFMNYLKSLFICI